MTNTGEVVAVAHSCRLAEIKVAGTLPGCAGDRVGSKQARLP